MARVLISMPEQFLSNIDSVAEYENRSRSELIRQALRAYMDSNSIKSRNRAVNTAKQLEKLL